MQGARLAVPHLATRHEDAVGGGGRWRPLRSQVAISLYDRGRARPAARRRAPTAIIRRLRISNTMARLPTLDHFMHHCSQATSLAATTRKPQVYPAVSIRTSQSQSERNEECRIRGRHGQSRSPTETADASGLGSTHTHLVTTTESRTTGNAFIKGARVRRPSSEGHICTRTRREGVTVRCVRGHMHGRPRSASQGGQFP